MADFIDGRRLTHIIVKAFEKEIPVQRSKEVVHAKDQAMKAEKEGKPLPVR